MVQVGLFAVQVGEIVNAWHHGLGVEDAEITTKNAVGFACDFLYRAVDTKAFFKKLDKLFWKIFF